MHKYRSADRKENKGIRAHRRLSLKIKFFLTSFSLVLAAVAVFALLSVFHLGRFSEVVEEADLKRSEIIERDITGKMQEVAISNLTEYVDAAARVLDGELSAMEYDLQLLAFRAADILENPGRYRAAEIDTPDAAKAGEVTSYILYSETADRSDEVMASDISMLANLCPIMEKIAAREDEVREVMIALPGGATIYTDRHAEQKLDGDGNPLPFDAVSRPFYVGVTLTHDTYFANTDADIFNGEPEVAAGVPVYVDRELRAVCGAARHLSDLEDIMQSIDYSDVSNICLLNEMGVILYSQWDEGELRRDEDEPGSLPDSENRELAGLADKALKGGRGCERVTVDGEPVYMAYAPLESVGWTLLMGISQSTLEQPAKELLVKTGEIKNETLIRTRRMSVQTSIIMLLIAAGLIFINIFLSLRHSVRLVKPLIQLKDAGRRFIEEDDSHIDENSNYFGELKLYTGDEIEDLWSTMGELEANIASSVRNLERVTAEKERIDTELSVATRIQSDMLPGIFPAFPEKSEFDLYSVMHPAREVGGDFYDFFLTDDDHLALVMADVSGKGVPAALFMVVAKTLIKNVAVSGGCDGPGEMLASVNNELCRNNTEEMFVTVWLGIIDISNGHMVSASGGHEYPVICRRGESYELIKDIHGPGLGTFEDVTYDEWEGQLHPGDQLFLYTDGIPEATDAHGELFGMDRMIAALNDSRSEELLSDRLASVKRAVDDFVGDAPQFDDLTMTIFEYKG